jgi:flagellar hook-associated protein 3 FlgL
MRVTSNSFPTALQYQLESLATKQARLQSQAATGQRFKAPSEDPRATRKVLELQQETRRLTQYNENIDLSNEKLNSIYGAVQALKKVSDRAGELAAMVDDMKSKDQLAAYRQEINQLIEQSVQIANTNNQFGYIFAGNRSNAEAYEISRNEAGEISGVSYQGTTDTVGIEIAKGSSLSVQMPGSNTSESGVQGLFETREGSFFQHLIELRDKLDGGTREDVAYIRETVAKNLMKDESNVIYHISRVGALEARLETAKTMGSRRITAANEFVSKEVDADLAKTLVKLNEIQTAYLAALKSGATIMNQSLLDYV